MIRLFSDIRLKIGFLLILFVVGCFGLGFGQGVKEKVQTNENSVSSDSKITEQLKEENNRLKEERDFYRKMLDEKYEQLKNSHEAKLDNVGRTLELDIRNNFYQVILRIFTITTVLWGIMAYLLGSKMFKDFLKEKLENFITNIKTEIDADSGRKKSEIRLLSESKLNDIETNFKELETRIKKLSQEKNKEIEDLAELQCKDIKSSGDEVVEIRDKVDRMLKETEESQKKITEKIDEIESKFNTAKKDAAAIFSMSIEISNLIKAIQNKDSEKIDKSWEYLESVMKTGLEEGGYFLHLATLAGNIKLVSRLIDMGANINEMDNEGKAPLHYAIMGNHNNIADHLINKNADINLMSKNGITPLHIAIGKCNRDLVKVLISKNADVNVKNNKGRSPLHIAAAQEMIETAKLLISKGAQIDIQDSFKFTPLHLSVLSNDIQIVRYLLSCSADINCQTIFGQTPLHIAIERNYERIAIILISDDNIDINIKDKLGRTPLHYVAFCGNIEIARNLMNKNVSSLFTMGDIINLRVLIDSLKDPKSPYEKRIRDFFNQQLKDEIDKCKSDQPIGESIKESVIAELNKILGNRDFYDAEVFSGLNLAEGEKQPLKNGLENLSRYDLWKLNRLLFEKIYPHEISKSHKNADINAMDNKNRTPLDCAIQYKEKEIYDIFTDKGAKTNIKYNAGGTQKMSVFFTKYRACPINLKEAYYNELLGGDVHKTKKIAFFLMVSVFPAFPKFFYWTLLTKNMN